MKKKHSRLLYDQSHLAVILKDQNPSNGGGEFFQPVGGAVER